MPRGRAQGAPESQCHYDAQIFWDPWCTISGWHGVTSVAIGNCGFGFAPVAPELRERSMLSMTRNEAVSLAAMRAGMPWDWETFPEFLDSLERTPKALEVVHDLPGDDWRRVRRASGYKTVMVNGSVTIEDDEPIADANSGALLRHGGGRG
jgi:N-acyl-D-aspartate/D-glutamate deacylase